jgi:hypothetical protein
MTRPHPSGREPTASRLTSNRSHHVEEVKEATQTPEDAGQTEVDLEAAT